ncbi:unnamed protein product [Adineta steineri]|uniref:RanBP2-type domain-containing protein n=1 Tax=Adineta steineri TaxID=433720 RepID=A0A819KYQ8_9BILA|nr:unnamed protein product [Adineta steineri]CAF3956435.1 unnamed protein product [Adineta steineri]
MCKNPLDSKDDLVSTKYGQTYHRICAQDHRDTKESTNGPVGGKDSTLGEALDPDKPTTEAQCPTSIVSTIMATALEAPNMGDKQKNYWKCQNCSIKNEEPLRQCEACGQPQHTLSTSDVSVDSAVISVEVKYKQSKSWPEDQNNDFDRPPKPMPRKRTIRHRLSAVCNVELVDVKCYAKFGIGYICVKNNQIKEYLVKVVGKMAWDSTEESVVFSFKDTIEFVSYVVFDRTNENKDIKFPKSDEVVRRWIDNYNGETPLGCDQLNIQYPNIYRIVSKSLNELLRVASKPELVIKNQRARVYPCADCSYFEDLPTSTTENQLRELICNAIESNKISLSSICIQFNKQMNNVCILATDMARKWAKIASIYIGDEFISKKKSLGCRLLLRPVRQKDEADTIIRHEIFAGKAKIFKHSGQNLILKIYDENVYDKCLNNKTLSIGKGIIVSMMIYTGTTILDPNEIDVETWYGKEMLQCESGIIPFIRQPEHMIFRLKWNAQIWLEQFERINTLQKEGSRNNDNEQKQDHIWANKLRHLLRMTVMLNTLAAIRKKTYMIGNDEIQLNLNSKLRTIVYNHKSKLQYGGPIPIQKIPYKTTEVKVVNDDCLVIYEHLINQGRKPLLLNMASATSPGGGYRKGDGAQEENLFRRSDYFRSLDIDLDKFEQPSERFQCTSTCNLDCVADARTMYPMDEYGAIYTSGLTVFRQPEMKGYEFMEKPLTDVCSLATAAYRHPPLDGNMLSPKYAVGMRKKIENIFAIAYHNRHDSLVLSALGCGAFRNPPDHVAKIFRSAIEQYAGFFQLIVFAIIDDHNAGLNSNPKGNFLPFQHEFKRSIFKPIQPNNQANTMFGPYRFLSNGSTVCDVSIYDSIPCNFGAKCRDLHDSKHTRQFSHPSLCTEACVTGTCSHMNDIVHMYSFIHQNICPHGSQCRDIDDRKHAREFEHPSDCPNGSACQDTTDDHEKEYRHLPLCKDAHQCNDYRKHVRAHCDAYRHCKPYCQYGRYCAYFHDGEHFKDYKHPFPLPCPWTPYHCILYDEFTKAPDIKKVPRHILEHCSNFAHVCQFGRNCLEQSSLHWSTTIHVLRCVCLQGKECMKLNQEDHLNSFTHPNVQDIRYLCKNNFTCQECDNVEHKIQYRHGLAYENTTVVPYYDLNRNINFFENQQQNILRVMTYIKRDQWQPFTLKSIHQDIFDWIRTVQPIHRCRSEVFELLLLHEHVMSGKYMEYFRKPKFVADCIFQHNRVKSICNLHRDPCMEHARNYIETLIIDIYHKHEFLKIDSVDSNDEHSSTNNDDIIQREEDFLSKYISQDDMKLIHQIAKQIAEASIKLHTNSDSISHSFDKKLKTNRHVLSVLGPYVDNDCNDIVIVFKREILHHPDSNFSVQTAASYVTGRCYKYRPWLGTDSDSEAARIKLFNETKLHASIPGYDQALAIELIALTSYKSRQRTMDIDLDMILRRLVNAHSQDEIEARLPQVIPLDYIDHIYMTQNIYNSFDARIGNRIQTIFRNRLTILSTKSDEEYNRAVIDALIQQFDKRAIQAISRSIQGFVFTIPPTNFTDNLALPLTISQAYANYHMQHPKASTDMTIYIYWQAMNGDMMLTLSNEQLNSSQSQAKIRCLICYISEKPVVTNTQYNEYPSYLSLDHPSQHQTLMNQNRYVIKSTSFYRGCNLDDFMTFCLEIQPSNGKVKLSHANSNSIYNHKVLSYTFDKSEIDLTKLEFIHVSAGTHTVSIQNFFVTFEKQIDLHSKIDIKFDQISSTKKASSSDVQVHRGHGKSRGSSRLVVDDHARGSCNIRSQVKNKTINQTVDYFVGKKNTLLTPCSHGINCLIQFSDNGSAHNSKYSHPCRFAELCRDLESHLTHEPRQATTCAFDQKCKLLNNPYHRARYRHSSLPYFLIPCRYQSQCKDTSPRHRIKYSHGEKVLEPMQKLRPRESSKASSQYDDRNRRIPCRWGAACRDKADPQHRTKYSHHTTSTQKQKDARPLCRAHSQYSD